MTERWISRSQGPIGDKMCPNYGWGMMPMINGRVYDFTKWLNQQIEKLGVWANRSGVCMIKRMVTPGTKPLGLWWNFTRAFLLPLFLDKLIYSFISAAIANHAWCSIHKQTNPTFDYTKKLPRFLVTDTWAQPPYYLIDLMSPWSHLPFKQGVTSRR